MPGISDITITAGPVPRRLDGGGAPVGGELGALEIGEGVVGHVGQPAIPVTCTTTGVARLPSVTVWPGGG